MAWELLVDEERGIGVFTCNTADVAFGPLVSMHGKDVMGFYNWWNDVIGKYNDPRSMKESDLHDAVFRWYGIQYEIKFEMVVGDKVFEGEYYPLNYVSIKGIYDESDEFYEEWDLDDWTNVMESVFKNRECDMEGEGGQMSGYLHTKITLNEDQEYIRNPDTNGPMWRIVGIKNGWKQSRWGGTETWQWFKDGESVGQGSKAPWDEENKD